MIQNKKFLQYFKEYKWSNVLAMIRNNQIDSKVCTDDFKNKLVVITGSTSGIGYSTAKKYASMGANLLCINRNIEKSKALKNEIEDKYGVKYDYIIADLSKIKDIEKAIETLKNLSTPIDVLIHNAGIYLTKKQLTPDGLELVFVVNYLSSFLINYKLKEKLKKEGKTRILLVGSEGHRFAAWGINLEDLNFEKRRYSGYRSYGSSKIAQVLSMHIFNDYFKDSGVTINTVHPGAVKSDTGKENGILYRWFKKSIFEKMLDSPEVSAEALYYLGVSKDIEGVSNKFFNKTKEEELTPPALDKEVARKLWNKSIEIYEKYKEANK